jgi:hypothetical protein
MSFDEFDLPQAKKIIDERDDTTAQIARDLYNGEHFGRDGEYWIGPWPQETDQGDARATRQAIRRGFVAKNAVRQVVGRHVNGVAGTQFQWEFAVRRELVDDEEPEAGERALIDEAQAALQTWLDRVEAQEIFQQLAAGALLGKRGVLRLFVPPGVRDANGNVPAGDLEEQLGRVWLQCLNQDEDTLEQQAPGATVYLDKTSRAAIGIMVYKDADKQDRAELVYLDDAGNTVLRIVGEGGDLDAPAVLPLGGRLTLYELTRDALVTPQVIAQQKALNLAETMRSRNDVMGGFLERILLNTQMPGQFVDDPSLPEGKRFVPEPLNVGPGTSNVFQGVVYTDTNGNERMATPSVNYRDPVPPDTFIRSSDAAYINILSETNQLHYAMAQDATASGLSRQQAREEYMADLNVTGDKLESAMRWALEAALAMAAYFAGTPGRFEGLRATVNARIEAGKPTPDEMRVAADLRDRGVWDLETAIRATGIDDPQAVRERMAADRRDEQGQEAERVAGVQGILDALRNGNGNGAAETNGGSA